MAHSGRRGRLPPEARSRAFLLLSAALTLAAFGAYAASLTLIPLLTERGFSASLAATTLGLLGAGQLLGRIGYGPLTARSSPTGRTVAIVVASAAMLGLLAVLTGPPALLVVVAVAVGAARGAGTLLQATIVADRWGTARYGTLAGLFSAPITIAAAIAPWGGTALAERVGSYPAMLWVLCALVLVAAALAAWSGRSRVTVQPPGAPSS